MLDSLGVGMDKPLVDNEGFPRADVDLYTVRESKSFNLSESSFSPPKSDPLKERREGRLQSDRTIPACNS
jgi:hypothetical protein